MGCRNRGFQAEDESASLNDALLFTTMCIIGLPVDVHIKDGSIYSGIFDTACVEHDFAIVLKRARMKKKGNCDANVANGSVVETLVVLSEDLVQVVAKRVLLPAEGFAGNETGNDTGAVAGTFAYYEYPEKEAKTIKASESTVDQLSISQRRCSSGTDNGSALGFKPQQTSHSGNTLEVENRNADQIGSTKKGETFSVQDNGRQVGDNVTQDKKHNKGEKSQFQKEQTKDEDQVSSPSLNTCHTQLTEIFHAKTYESPANGVLCDGPAASIFKVGHQCHERQTLAENFRAHDAIRSEASTAGSSVVDASSESCLSSSSTPTEMVPPKSSTSNRTAKEFKLNPGAKIFSPSFAHQRSATPPAVPTAPSLTYIPENYPVAPVLTAQSEVEIRPFAPRSSLPVKFVPYNNLLAGNGGSDVQHSPPIIGHMASRTQPIRYGGQYHHPLQAGPTYVHPNSQNVMVGRLGQLVYVHPVSQDAVQGTTGFSQVSTCSLLTPHQVHLPKHQGSAAAQTLQLCVAPPFIAANGQPPFVVPSHIPISQPPFPVIRPISVPGSNGFLGSKFP